MPTTTPFALSTMFSQLLGREVQVAAKPRPASSKAKVIYGVYKTQPGEQVIVVRADLALMGSLGGVLIGLPDSEIADRLKQPQLDGLLRDGIHEVFNILSTPLAVDGRVVFQTMHTDAVLLKGDATRLLKAAPQASLFSVSLDGYTGGEVTILRG